MDLMSTAQLLGNFGEFLGAIAVLLTLIYLTVQLRHSSRVIEMNTEVIQAESWANTFQMELEFDRLMIGDSDIMDLWLRGGIRGDLDTTDLQRWRRLVRTRINLARAGFQRAKVGGTPPGRFVDLLARETMSLPEFKRYWQLGLGTNPAWLPDRDFVSAVNEAIDQYESGILVDPLPLVPEDRQPEDDL
jgi:hypothetical protein